MVEPACRTCSSEALPKEWCSTRLVQCWYFGLSTKTKQNNRYDCQVAFYRSQFQFNERQDRTRLSPKLPFKPVCVCAGFATSPRSIGWSQRQSGQALQF